MARENWQWIRDQLSAGIANGELAPGSRLPIEPELCQIYGAGRHSVRRAVAALAVDGKLRVEQGRGTFVEDAPLLNYHIGKRVRFRQNLRDQGVTPGGSIIEALICPAPATVAKALQLDEGTLVHCLKARGAANGVTIGISHSYHEAARFPDLSEKRQAGWSVTDIYKSHGIADYVRLSTTIFARPARDGEAAQLHQHPSLPVMVVRKTDGETGGRPIGYSEAVWSADRVRFSFEDPPEEDIGPTGP